MCKICYPAICCFFIYFPCCKEDKQMWASSQTWVTAPSCRLLQASVLFFFFFAGPDGMLNLHTIHKHTQKHTQTQTSKYQMCSSTPSHQTSRGHGQLWLRKEENKQVRNATLKTHAKNNIYWSVDHPPCFYRFQLTISACSGSLKR